MAPPAPTPHARSVPLHRTDGDAPAVQRGLPGVAPEEAPLPSEKVLSGALLNERQREALAGLQAALGPCPEGFSYEEWRVVLSLLRPPPVPPGTLKGRGILLHRARECFPGYAAPAALRMYVAARDRPHVAEFVANFRALEAVDIMEQRAMWRDGMDLARQILVMKMQGTLGASLEDHVAGMEAADVARLAMAMAAATKTAAEFDGLRAPPPARTVVDTDAGPGGASTSGEDPRALLAAKIERVAEDLAARKENP